MKGFNSIEAILECLSSSTSGNMDCMNFYHSLFLFIKDSDHRIPYTLSHVRRILRMYSKLNSEICSLYNKFSVKKQN